MSEAEILPKREASSWPPRLMFNTDGNWMNNYQDRHEPTDITKLVGPLRDAGVDLLSVLIGIDDDLSWRGSPHGQLWCDNVTEWNVDGVLTDIHGHPIKKGAVHIHGRTTANQQATNAHEELFNTLLSVIEDGHDVMQIYVNGARQQGLPIVGSIRMNDAHTDSEDRMWYGRNALKIERPDLLIGSALPQGTIYGSRWTFSWLWDYAQAEVRDRFLGIMDDTLTRYDFDGLELDFCRQPPFFRGGESVQNIPVMTDFVRQGLQIVRRHAAERGRELRLIVRVPGSIGETLALGIDTLTWIREELADAVVLASPGYCVTPADVAAAVEAADNGPVLIYRGFDGSTYSVSPQEGYERNAPAVLRGAGLNGYREGACGIALFNYDYGTHRAGPVPGDYHDLTADHLQTICDLREPETLASRNRCYYLGTNLPGGGGFGDHNPVLPRELALRGRGAGDGHALHLTIKDDLDAGTATGRIHHTELRLRLSDYKDLKERIHLAVNDRRIPFEPDRTISNDKGDEWLVFDDPGLCAGSNSVLLILEGASTPKPWPVLHNLEAMVICA